MTTYRGGFATLRVGDRENQLGYVTSISIDRPSYELTDLGDQERSFVSGPATIEGSFVAPYSDIIMECLMGSRNLSGPVHRKEWLCLYCGAAHPAESFGCNRCGAPRTWIL